MIKDGSMMRLRLCALYDLKTATFTKLNSPSVLTAILVYIFMGECGVCIWRPAGPLGQNPVDDAYNGKVT